MEDNTFYRFGHNSSYTRRFTWATSIDPRSSITRRVCPEYNVVEEYPSGAFNVIVEGGSKYPDILKCGSYPFLIVSEKVVSIWYNADIKNFIIYPVGISQVNSKKLEDIQPPKYFRIEIEGQCKIDLEASRLKVIRHAPKCHYLVTKPSTPAGFIMKANSWDGSDLFRDSNLYPRVNFCTQRVLNLASKYKLTNFRFELMEGPFNPGNRGIDYLQKSG